MLRDSQLLTGTINGLRYQRENRSEEYVEIPPAHIITDERGGMWTFGPEYEIHNGHYHFNVLRNDIDVGEMAEKIVFRRGAVSIFGRFGWRRWSGTTFV